MQAFLDLLVAFERMMSQSMAMEIFLKLGIALLLSGMAGYERQRKGEAAGLRTHILVCLGATMLMVISDHFAMEWSASHTTVWLDRGRIAAGIIMGVGFLGGGTILHYGHEQRGLTTAAMIWFVASLGVAIGAGYFSLAFVSTGFALIVVVGLGALEKYIPSRGYFVFELHVKQEEADMDGIRREIAAMGHFRVVSTRVRHSCGEETVQLTYRIEARNAKDFGALLKKLHGRFPSASLLLLERQN